MLKLRYTLLKMRGGRGIVDLNSLKLFVAAAHAGSLSAAARRTAVPLATLSRQVRSLEDDLGVRLLERSAQGLTLTDAGSRLLAAAEPALTLLAQAEQGLHETSGISGKIRVSLPPHFAPLWQAFEGFSQRHPGVRFDIFVTDRRVDLMSDGIDVAIRVGDGGRSSYVGRTLVRYRHRLVAAPGYLQGLVIEKPQDLSSLSCGCWRSAGSPSWQLGDTVLALEPAVATNDYQHLLELAIHGRLITELPPFLAYGPLERGLLVEVIPAYPLPLQSVRALVADTRLLSPLVRRFLDYLAETARTALDPYAQG